VLDIFKIGSCGIICLGWLQTSILLIAASWIDRITGVSHQRPATHASFFFFLEHMLLNIQLQFNLLVFTR
jgi:hypothetical protein